MTRKNRLNQDIDLLSNAWDAGLDAGYEFQSEQSSRSPHMIGAWGDRDAAVAASNFKGATTREWQHDGSGNATSSVAAPAPTLDEPAHNGTADPTAAVARSNDQRIDGLLRGTQWSDGSISYSTPDAPGDYQAGYFSDVDRDSISAQNEGFSQFSAQQLDCLHFAFNTDILGQSAGAAGFAVEGFTNLTISFAGAGTATMRYANTSDAGTAYNFFPSAAITGGDGWFGPNTRAPDEGNYSWMTTLHEVGHGLALQLPFFFEVSALSGGLVSPAPE